MRLLLFKVCFFFLFLKAFGQEKLVLDEHISATNISKLALQLENIPVEFSTSKDDKIHVVFKMNFVNYSPQEVDSVLNNIKLNKKVENATLSLDIKSVGEISKTQYSTKKELSEEHKKFLHEYLKNGFKKNKKKPKTKEEFLRQEEERFGSMKSFFEARKKAIENDKNSKYQEAIFTIQIPKKLTDNLMIKAYQARLNFIIEKLRYASVFKDGGSFTIDKLEESEFTNYNGVSRIKSIKNSEIVIKSAVGNSFGEVENSRIDIDDSNLQIGEIGKNVTMKDFNSKIYLYNFSDNFKTFNFNGEYSTIYFFEPKNNHEMVCFGHDTVFYFDGKNSIVSQPSKSGKKSKMMERKRKKNKPFGGAINFDIVHTKFYYPEKQKK